MKALNTVKITFPSRSVNEGFARSALSAFAAQADPTLDELADVKTAVSEAVTNCIVHAYANTIGPNCMRTARCAWRWRTRGAVSRMSPRQWSRCSLRAAPNARAWALR